MGGRDHSLLATQFRSKLCRCSRSRESRSGATSRPDLPSCFGDYRTHRHRCVFQSGPQTSCFTPAHGSESGQSQTPVGNGCFALAQTCCSAWSFFSGILNWREAIRYSFVRWEVLYVGSLGIALMTKTKRDEWCGSLSRSARRGRDVCDRVTWPLRGGRGGRGWRHDRGDRSPLARCRRRKRQAVRVIGPEYEYRREHCRGQHGGDHPVFERQ